MPELLMGDEAVSLGAIHAGIGGVFSYPGTPATEIFEYFLSHIIVFFTYNIRIQDTG